MRKLSLYLLLLCQGVFIYAQKHDSNTNNQIEQQIDRLLSQMTLEEKCLQMTNNAPGISRLGILPYNWWNESLHGVARNGKATVFPEPIALGATFDTELVYRVANAISDEARAKFNITQQTGNYSQYAGLTFWSPNVNIFRDPRWGRGMETYGEDPCLTSTLGVAFVKGMQGNHPLYLKTSACAKHYAVHSGPEALRHEFDAIPTTKDLYETYLPAFKALVTEGKVDAVMGAYNRVYGESASASQLLLIDILRKQWGFKGHVVTDCGALDDIHLYHKITESAVESAALAAKNGANLNCGTTYEHLPEAVKQGLVSESTIDSLLRPLLRTRIRLGILGEQSDNPYCHIGDSAICNPRHQDIAREAARKSMVLLQNKNALPLDNDIKTLFITGPFATDINVLLGNYYGLNDNCYTFLEGIVSCASPATTINYKQGIMPVTPNRNPIDWVTGEAAASDAVIVCLGISNLLEGEEGEAIASDYKGDRLSLELPQHQIDFLEKIYNYPNRKARVIVVLTGGSPILLDKIVQLSDAIVMAWYPGQAGGLALGDILFGKISPSGKLPITFPVNEKQLPEYEDYSMKGRTYRYMTEKPMYPFGFGLTYSNIEIDDLQTNAERIKKGNGMTVTTRVKNVGEYKTDEVLQVYMTLPDGEDNPLCSLKSFKRITLEPQEETSVTFDITPDMLTSITDKGETVTQSGKYKVFIGNCSPSHEVLSWEESWQKQHLLSNDTKTRYQNGQAICIVFGSKIKI